MLRSEPLYYLVELAHCNSYRIASENLHITQPALSIAIKKLEAELGVVLLERTTKKIKLTEIGEKVVSMSEHLLEHLNEIEQVTARRSTDVHYDYLTLYTFPAISESILGQMMMNLQLEESLGKLIIKNMRFEEMMSLLLEDEYAFALAWQLDNDQRTFENIDCHKLYCAKAQLMLSPESELIARQVNSIAFRDILQLPLVSFEGGYGIDQLMFELMKERYGMPNKVTEVPNIILFNQLIQSGTAVAFGVDLMGWKSVGESHDYRKNRFIPIKENIIFDFKLYHHKNCSEQLKGQMIKLFEANL